MLGHVPRRDYISPPPIIDASTFMSTCLSGGAAETKGPHCTKGKPYGNSCIAMVRGELGARWHRKRDQQHCSRGKTPFHRWLSRSANQGSNRSPIACIGG